MSDAVINIRCGEVHFQVVRSRPFIRISRNPYHAEARKIDPAWRWFEIY